MSSQEPSVLSERSLVEGLQDANLSQLERDRLAAILLSRPVLAIDSLKIIIRHCSPEQTIIAQEALEFYFWRGS